MASHVLSNTKTTILGATPGAIPGIGGNPHEGFSFAHDSRSTFSRLGGLRALDRNLFRRLFGPFSSIFGGKQNQMKQKTHKQNVHGIVPGFSLCFFAPPQGMTPIKHTTKFLAPSFWHPPGPGKSPNLFMFIQRNGPAEVQRDFFYQILGGEFIEGEFLRGLFFFSGKNRSKKFGPKIQGSETEFDPKFRVHKVQKHLAPTAITRTSTHFVGRISSPW